MSGAPESRAPCTGHPWPLLVACVALLLASCSPPPALVRPVSIIVRCEPFADVETSARSEERVNWWDSDPRDDDACTESFAALELRRHLGRALDGFSLRALRRGKRSVFVVEGNSRTGTLYGVYEFLEQLGVRSYGLGDSGITYPATPPPLPRRLRLASSPAFLTRGFWAWEPRGNPDFFLWMARNRMNLWTAAEEHPARLEQLGIRLTGGGHSLQANYLNPEADVDTLLAEFRGRYYPTTFEQVAVFDAALDAALAGCRNPLERARLADDAQCFAYGEATFALYDHLLRTVERDRAADRAGARHELALADSAASRLRAMRDVVQVAASHASAPDGLEASHVEATLAHFHARLRADGGH